MVIVSNTHPSKEQSHENPREWETTPLDGPIVRGGGGGGGGIVRWSNVSSIPSLANDVRANGRSFAVLRAIVVHVDDDVPVGGQPLEPGGHVGGTMFGRCVGGYVLLDPIDQTRLCLPHATARSSLVHFRCFVGDHSQRCLGIGIAWMRLVEAGEDELMVSFLTDDQPVLHPFLANMIQDVRIDVANVESDHAVLVQILRSCLA